jgi:hypothetical protein
MFTALLPETGYYELLADVMRWAYSARRSRLVGRELS